MSEKVPTNAAADAPDTLKYDHFHTILIHFQMNTFMNQFLKPWRWVILGFRVYARVGKLSHKKTNQCKQFVCHWANQGWKTASEVEDGLIGVHTLQRVRHADAQPRVSVRKSC